MSKATLVMSDILNRLIKKNNLSESKLAKIIKVPKSTINRLTSGKTANPRVSTLIEIADYFNISLDQLMGKQPLNID